MENSRFWIFLSIGVAAMLSMKYFASPDAAMSHWKNGWHTAYDADDAATDGRRLHAHGGGTSRPRPIVAGLESSMRHTTSASIEPANPVKTTAKVDPKKAAKDAADKKKKDDAAKKKKAAAAKKKTDIDGGQFQATLPPLPDSTKTDGSKYDPSAPQNSGGANAATAAPAPATGISVSSASNTKNLTLKDWEELLIVTPSHDETVKFIQSYQAKQVSSDIFYAIIKEMLADKRQVLNQYGVSALTATPSVLSLNMLLTVPAADTTVTTQVNTALAAYETLSYLGVLKTALVTSTSTSSSATNLPTLLQLVTASAQKNLTGTSGTTTAGGETTQGGVAASTKASYASVVAELNSLKSKATDAATQQEIASAIATLQGLGIGTATTAVAEANREYYRAAY